MKPPPLIPYCDTSGHGLKEEDFRALFDYLYVEGAWYTAPPGERSLRVVFEPHHFRHAFYKEPGKGQRRTLWKPDRAGRLLWIGYTVENPAEVYQVGASRFNLFCRMADHSAPWYLVVIDQTGEWVASFVTAYPLGHKEAVNQRRIGKLLGE